jgi:hypothetical protein
MDVEAQLFLLRCMCSDRGFRIELTCSLLNLDRLAPGSHSLIHVASCAQRDDCLSGYECFDGHEMDQ